MSKSRKLLFSALLTALLLFFFYACIPGGGGVRSSRLFIPSGSGITGAVTVSGGMTNTKEQMYWLAEALEDAGIIALAITAGDNMSVPGYQSAHEEGVEMLQTNSQIASRLGKIGIMGFSMGGGAVVNLGHMEDVDVVVAMAPFGPSPRSGYHAATAIFTGTRDTTAPARMGKSAFDRIPDSVPRLYASVEGVGHMHWMSSGRKGSELDLIVAWAQYYLNGDESAYGVFSSGEPNGLTDYEFYPGDGTSPGPGPGPGPTPPPAPGPCN